MTSNHFTHHVLVLVLTVVLMSAIGCGEMVGGSKRVQITENQAPYAALVAVREAHPGAQIDEIQCVYSNGPTNYCLHYHMSGPKPVENEYRYSAEYGERVDLLLPTETNAGFHRTHPAAVIDEVEYLDDVAAHAQCFRIRFHGVIEEARVDANGETVSGTAPPIVTLSDSMTPLLAGFMEKPVTLIGCWNRNGKLGGCIYGGNKATATPVYVLAMDLGDLRKLQEMTRSIPDGELVAVTGMLHFSDVPAAPQSKPTDNQDDPPATLPRHFYFDISEAKVTARTLHALE